MRTTRLVTAAACILFTFTACHKRTSASLPPVPALPPAPVLALEEADRAFTEGNYTQAAQGYEKYLQLAPSGGQRDQALFRLGLTYALRVGSTPDWSRVTSVLRQLVEEHPNSPLRIPATLILSLRSEIDQMATNMATNTKQRDDRIRQLSTELERLKRIDAERKRGTSR